MAPDNPDVEFPRCRCGHAMRLFGIEWDTEDRDLYTFVCDVCGDTAVRSVPARPAKNGKR